MYPMKPGCRSVSRRDERQAGLGGASTRARTPVLAALALGVAVAACGNDAPAPAQAGGSGSLAAGGSSAAVAGGGMGTGVGGSVSSAGQSGAPSTGGTGGASGTGATGGALAGTGGGGAPPIGGGAGSAASGAGGNPATGGTAGRGMGSGGSAVGGAAGSAAGRSGTGGVGGLASGGSAGAAAGAGGAPACVKGTTKGGDVLLIGDSFIALSGDITKDLNTIARSAGALAASDAFRDNSVSGTQLSGGISPQIPVQYANGQKQAPVKIVIMDGGGNDMLNNTCSDPPTASCQGIQNAVTAVKALFSQMGKDGVESVVFFFYPENQKNATQKAKIDVLRSLLQDVCYSSASPKCYGVDLRPVFDGHFTEYVLSDGIHPTAAGSQASAEAIWSVMQQNCIAQ